MANEMRDRLVELFKRIEYTPYLGSPSISNLALQFTDYALYSICDDLIENGVRILPCDVGDTIYYLDGSIIVESKVHCVSFGGRYGDYKGGQIHIYDSDKDNITVKLDNFGKTVFLIKSEAEQKLKEMRGE
jgi:hypothetical protein